MAGSIRDTISMMIEPSHDVIHLAYLYTKAKRQVVNWLIENNPQFKKDSELLNILHHEWYERLKKEMGLPSRLALDCYRDAGNVYKSWVESPNRSKTKT